MKIIKSCGISVFRLIMLSEALGPYLVVVDTKDKSYKIIDFAVSGDRRIEVKEKDKIEK